MSIVLLESGRARPFSRRYAVSREAASGTLFIAIKPDNDPASRIYLRTQIIKRAHGFKGSIIEPDRLHITLFFFGRPHDQSENLIAKVHQAASELKEQQFEVMFDRTMSFASHYNHPFVLVGNEGVDRLRAFHTSLGAVMMRNDLKDWVHTLSTPHVTLLYDKQFVDEQPFEPVSWTVREFMLVRSINHQHVELARWLLPPT